MIAMMDRKKGGRGCKQTMNCSLQFSQRFKTTRPLWPPVPVLVPVFAAVAPALFHSSSF